MSSLDDQDWELVNAYHDGELSDQDRRAFDKRLARHPELAAALEDVAKVASSLKALKPASAELKPVPGRFRTLPVWAAACVALVVVALGGVFYSRSAPDRTPLDLHSAFASQSYAPGTHPEAQQVRFFGGAGVPDLEVANLFLVDFKSLSEDRFAAHYAGQNGCRLTLIASAAGTDLTAPAGANFEQWQMTELSFAVIATGMDQARFDAVSAYLHEALRQAVQPETVLAMGRATNAAAPCSQA